METKKPNWLFRGFLLVSAIIHGLLLMEVSGLYASRDLSPIEVTLEAPQFPSARTIPIPPQRPKTPPKTESQAIKIPHVVSMRQPPKPAAAPALDTIPSSVAEAISAPDRPPVTQTGVVAWAMPGPASTGSESISPYVTQQDYFGMVRSEIERKKHYPGDAVRRQIEGRVRLRFILDQNGEVQKVSIVENSKHQILDQAALEALKAASPFPAPPSRLFKGLLTIDIVIDFQLT